MLQKRLNHETKVNLKFKESRGRRSEKRSDAGCNVANNDARACVRMQPRNNAKSKQRLTNKLAIMGRYVNDNVATAALAVKCPTKALIDFARDCAVLFNYRGKDRNHRLE